MAREGIRSPARVRADAAQLLLDAAERVIDREGLASLTTRAVAKEADLTSGLVHYHFASIDGLSVAVMKRVSARMLEQQRRIFASDHPFAEQWRLATRPLRGSGGRRQMKVWAEFAIAATNRPGLAPTMTEMNTEWRRIVVAALSRECERSGRGTSEVPIKALAVLATVVLKGMYIEHLQDFHSGHGELLALVDQFNTALGTGQISFEDAAVNK